MEIKNKIIAIKDVTYTDPSGLKEMVAKSEDILANEEVIEEKKLITEFLNTLAKDSKKVRYKSPQCNLYCRPIN